MSPKIKRIVLLWALCLISSGVVQNASAQQRQFRLEGRVLSAENSEPLDLVTIVLDGVTGALTDKSGTFSFTVAAGGGVRA